MAKLDAIMKEAIIKKYAEMTGRTIEEARAILEPLLEEEDEEILDLIQKISMLTNNGDGVSKDVAEAVKADLLLKLRNATENRGPNMDKFFEYKLMLEMLNNMTREQRQEPDPHLKIMEERMTKLEETLNKLMDVMIQQQQSSEKNELIKTLKMMQETMQKQIDTLREELRRIKEDNRLIITPDKLPEIKEQLEALGLEIKKAGSDFDPEAAKKLLEKLGYKVEPGWISADELVKILEKEREKVKKEIRERILEEVETKKVETAEKIVTTAIDKLFDLFEPVVPDVLRSALGLNSTSKETIDNSTAMGDAVDEFLEEKKGGKSGSSKSKRKGRRKNNS